MVNKQKSPPKPLKTRNVRRKSRVPQDKKTRYTNEYLTNGYNKTQAYLTTNPRSTYRNANKNTSQNHNARVDKGMIEDYDKEKERIRQKAWKKVDKTLEKKDKEGRDTAKAIVVGDKKDKDININTNIVSQTDIKSLETILERLEARDSKDMSTHENKKVDKLNRDTDKAYARTFEGKPPIEEKSEGI